MASKPTQARRIGSLTTALGEDKLVLTRFEGTEGLSQLFEYRVEALSVDANIDFNPAIGEKCCIALNDFDGSKRYFNGILVATQWTGVQEDYCSYRLVIRPWFWLLTRSANCRMFKDKSVPDIIKDVLGAHGGFAKFEPKLNASYPQLKYCVQYRETDYDFVCRLAEEFGIYFYFKHSESDHVLVLSDGLSSHLPKDTGEKLQFHPMMNDRWVNLEHVSSWTPERRFNTGKVILNDYDFKNPGALLIAEKENGGGYQNDKLAQYDYPGRYKEKDLGVDLATVRLESMQAQDHRCQAAGNAVHCMPGSLVTLAGHPESILNKRYLVVQATHTYSNNSYRSAAGGGGEDIYSGHYEFLPCDTAFRAPQVTPKPKVYGPQTAVVVGNGEIDVDEDGCIMVQFYWDRDKQQSRKVRLAQVWSGKNWGGIYIPRVGMEVVVQFVEGDPDRPLVIGTVYNGDNPTPYELPGEKTKAGVKSKTDGSSGYNEFVFDDRDGDELVRMHAQRDHETKVENDERRDIGNDISKKVGNNEKVDIGHVYEMEAGTQNPMGKIEFKVGKSKIVMDPISITIESPTIKIKASMLLDETSLITNVNADSILTLTGGLVKIN